MPSGNGAKAAQRRERVNKEKGPVAKSQLKTNEKALTYKCKICMQTFLLTSSAKTLKEHSDAKHPKSSFEDCYDNVAPPS